MLRNIKENPIREKNRGAAIEYIIHEGKASRAQIAAHLGINKASVSEIIKHLIEYHIVCLLYTSHGGSGSGDENIKQCVQYGINKINVGCDFMNANVASIKKHLEKDPDINYWVMMHQVEKDSQEIVKHYIRLSKSEGKSL